MNESGRTATRQPKPRAKSRKPPPRWRRYLEQAELELPTPAPGSAVAAASRDDDDASTGEPVVLPWWQTKPAVFGLLALSAALLVLTGITLRHGAADRAAATAADARVQTLTLRAITSERALRIAPNPRSWSSQPDASIAWPEPPQLLELYLQVGYSSYLTYALVVDKVDHGRVMVIERLTPDSNRDLRFAINSSAFGPGEYRMRLQGYSWRGERIDAGWVRLVVEPPR